MKVLVVERMRKVTFPTSSYTHVFFSYPVYSFIAILCHTLAIVKRIGLDDGYLLRRWKIGLFKIKPKHAVGLFRYGYYCTVCRKKWFCQIFRIIFAQLIISGENNKFPLSLDWFSKWTSPLKWKIIMLLNKLPFSPCGSWRRERLDWLKNGLKYRSNG